MAKTNVNREALFMEQYEILSDEKLMEVSGGGFWGSAISGLLGGLGGNTNTAQQVVNQLNGVTGFKVINHNPYGSGGTPND